MNKNSKTSDMRESKGKEFSFYKLSIFREILRELKTHYHYLKRVIEKNSELIISDIDRFRNSLEEKQHWFTVGTADPKEQSELLESLEEDYFLRFHYRNMLRKSLLLIVYTHFENTFRLISQHAEENNTSRIKIKDLNKSGGDTEQIKRYLDLIFTIDFSVINSDWSAIMNLSLIRNLVAHYDGNLQYFQESKGDQKYKKLERIIDVDPDLKIEKGQLVIVNDEYLHRMSEHCVNFIRQVALQLEEITQKKSYKVTYILDEYGAAEKIVEEM